MVIGMITLVTGGTRCGKAKYAESVLDSFEGRKYCIATMGHSGDEAGGVIARHYMLCKDKNFIALNQPRDIGASRIEEGCGVILECLDLLCLNEMYLGADSAADRIIGGIKKLAEKAAELVIVTNEVGSDGINYSHDTMNFIRQVAELNSRIAVFADNVIECVYGIPIVRKGVLR